MGPALGGSVALLAFLGGMFLAAAHERHAARRRRTAAARHWLTQATHVRRRRAGLGGEGLDRRRGVDGHGTVLLATNALPARHCPAVTSSD